MIVVAVRKYIILGTVLYLVSSWCVYSHYYKCQLKVALFFQIIRNTQLQSIQTAELLVIEQTVCTEWRRFTIHGVKYEVILYYFIIIYVYLSITVILILKLAFF
jgi:hypothetical protein